MSQFTVKAVEAAKQHARDEYPKESCGLIVRGEYIPVENIAADPLKDFEISGKLYQKHLVGGGLEAIVHSHPDGPLFPTEADMESQVATDLPWVILGVDEDGRVSDPIVWGADTPIAPVIGRQFVHGVTDCYSLIRDVYRLGKDKLKEQGVTDEWPFPPIQLPEQPRADAWWDDPEVTLYDTHAPLVGFVDIKPHEVKPGDLFFMSLGKTQANNHAGIYLGNNLVLHHLPGRLSRRELAGAWGRHANKWMRYEGSIDAA